MAQLDDACLTLEQSRLTVSCRTIANDGSKSPSLKPALDGYSPMFVERSLSKEKLLFNDSVLAVVSGSVENARIVSGEKGLLHTYSSRLPRLAQSSSPIDPGFKAIHAQPNSNLDVSADFSSLALNDCRAVVTSASPEKTHVPKAEMLPSGSPSPPPSHLTPLSPSGSSFVTAIVVSPLDLGRTSRPCATDEGKLLVRGSPPLAPPSSPTISSSFDVIRIFPGCDVEVSKIPPSVNYPPQTRSLSHSAPPKKNSSNPDLEDVVLVALAWTFAFACGFGFLLLLAEWTHSVFPCSLMVILSFALGVYLVFERGMAKRTPVFIATKPEDAGIRTWDLESIEYESREDAHSSLVQINGRFEVSSIPSSQDIFQSELLMNGQIISSTPRKDGPFPVTPTPAPTSSTSLTVFGVAGMPSQTSLRTRQTPYVSAPSSFLNVMQAAPSKKSKTR